MERRTFLGGLAMLLAASGSGCVRAVRQGAAATPLAITDITVRKELQADFPGTIAALRRIGYTHFGTRLRRYMPAEPEELPVEEKARILRDFGMQVGAARLAPQLSLAQQIEEAHRLGASMLVMSAGRVFFDGFKPRVPALPELLEFMRELDRIGEECRAGGIVFAYHNHSFDAEPVEGVRALDRMIEGTDPAKVSFEMDVAWAHIGGYDPLALAERLGSRLVSVHLKDVDRGRGPAITDQLVGPGEGEIDYRTLLPQLRARTNALLAVEIDAPTDGLASAERAFTFVEAALGQQSHTALRQ